MYIVSPSKVESATSLTRNLSIDGPRLTLTIRWKDEVHQVSGPFRAVDADRLLRDPVHFGTLGTSLIS